MGIFGKLKQNFNHGGVKISLQAPASVSLNDGMVPLTVTVQATDAPATINSVRVELNRQQTQQYVVGNNANTNVDTTTQTISKVLNSEVFNLAAGETKTLNLSLVMNVGKAAESALGNGALGQIAHGIGMLESATSAMSQKNYNYSFMASADVAGVTLDPTTTQPVQVLKPGEIGSGFNVKL